MNHKFSILINTTDSFEDCWFPFFTLFKKYWPEYQGKIYLNTETKTYTHEGLTIICLQNNKNNPNSRITWSECLRRALILIEDDIILYMQEDYFLTKNVKNESINYFSHLIYTRKEISCIQLTNGGIPAVLKSNYEMLFTSDSNYFSYLSCQASFWRKDIMISLIRDHETAWNFEWWGSKRAKYLKYDFLVVDPEIFEPIENNIIPYLMTGVIGGKWNRHVVELFQNHQIQMNYTRRGFYDSQKKLTIKKRILVKLSIWKLKSIVEIFIMKFYPKILKK